MKTLQILFLLVVALALGGRQAATAQIINGDFETRNSRPTAGYNVGPNAPDDLPSWNAIPYYNGSQYYYGNMPWYLTNDADPGVRPSNYSTTTHTGNGCALVYQHDAPRDHSYDASMAQQLPQPLLAGHRYLVQYWANRADLVPYHAKVAVYVTTGSAYYSYNGAAGTYGFTPSVTPTKTVASPETYGPSGWFLVSGYIDIPGGESNNQWVIVGPDRFDQYYEPAPWGQNGAIIHLVDDITLQDVGCIPGSGISSQLELTTDFGPMPDPPYPYINNYDDYCYSQRFTFTVPASAAEHATGFHWTVSGYSVNSGEVTSYAENGPTMSFIPTTTSPGAYRNVNVTCTVSYGPNCPAGESYRSLTISSQDEAGNPCVMYRAAQLPTPSPTTVAPATAYPNPANESLTLPQEATTATLLNSQGHLVGRSDPAGKMDVRRLPDGLYQLRMKVNGKIINQRIQIKH